MINRSTAYKMAVGALIKQRRLFIFDANIHDKGLVVSISSKRASKKVERINQAITIIEQEMNEATLQFSLRLDRG